MTQHTFTNSAGQQETATFEFIRKNELSFAERCKKISDGFAPLDWTDDAQVVEQDAARIAGFSESDKLMVKFW